MERYLWWDVVVKLTASFCGVASHVQRTTLIARGRPALPRCTDSESGDKMIDRVSIPVRLRLLGL